MKKFQCWFQNSKLPLLRETIELTWSAWYFTVDAMPLLAEVILNTFETVQSWHFLRSLAWTWLASCIMGWILMLDLTGRIGLGVGNFVTPLPQLSLTLSSIWDTVLRLCGIVLPCHSGWVLLASAQGVWILLWWWHAIEFFHLSFSSLDVLICMLRK